MTTLYPSSGVSTGHDDTTRPPHERPRFAHLGCPCGHLEPGTCITRTPLPVADRYPCSGICQNWGLPQIREFARTVGKCPACLTGGDR